MIKRKQFFSMSVIFSFLFIIMAFTPQLYSQWMGIYHDKGHSSRTALVAPDYPDSLIDWKFKTNDQVIATPVVGPAEYYYDDNGNGIYDPPETFEDANGNGSWDDGEMFDDANSNLQYDYGENFLDYNGNRRFDPGTLIAGSWDNTLYSINILRDENENSRIYWKYVLPDRITSSPTLGPGEYYFDSNRNGQFDPGENYIDENQNGLRDRNTIYVPCLDGTIYAFYSERADEGNVDWNGNGNKNDQVRLRWIFHAGSPIVSSCVVDVGEPFVDSNENGIYDEGEQFTDIYLNGVRDGSLEEPFEDLNSNGRYDAYLNEPYTDYNNNAIRDGITIYFVAFDGRLYALNEDGSLKWTTLLGKEGIPIDTTPAISLNGERIFVTSPDRRIYAVDAAGSDGIQGRVIWSYKTNGYISTSPAVSADNSVVFGTGYPDNKLYCFNYDGTIKFNPVDVKGWVHSSPAIGADGTIYIAVADYKPFYNMPMSRLVAVSSLGEILWTDSYAMPGQEIDTWLFSTPSIDNNGLIYFQTSDNHVYAVYPTGEIKWWVTLVGDAQSPPATTSAYWLRSTPIIGPDESFFVGSTDSYIYGLGKDIVRPKTTEPTIWAAGFANNPITTQSTQLTINAIIWDPEGNIARVEVYDPTKPSTPMIGLMTRVSNATEANSYNYQLVWDIPSGYFTPSEYIFFIKAFDAAGNQSDTWPRLTIHKITSGGSPIPTQLSFIMNPFVNQEFFQYVTPLSVSDDPHYSSPQGNSPPVINLAGFYKTYIDTTDGGTLQILAYVSDSNGVSDISKVEILFLYYGLITTIDITNLATQLSATENKYLFESIVGGSKPGGEYYFYIIAYDRQGNTTKWPYLLVN